MRSLVRVLLSRDPAIEVAGEAGRAQEARAAIKALNPDVVTLDVEMPGMNGLEFLGKIMQLRPTPVIMVSSKTGSGSAAAIEALEIGAFDCVAKPGPGEEDGFAAELASKVKAAAFSRVRLASRNKLCPADGQGAAPVSGYRPDGRVVAIGASTGGVEALTAILSEFPENGPPTVITQHMPRGFTKSFSERLNQRSRPNVSEAQDGAPLVPGHVYLAPGGDMHLAISPGAPHRCRLIAADPVNGHRPSVDVLLKSVAQAAGENALGVILTGMGRDGAQGLLAMRNAGARTLGQDEASCLIYGMPKAAFELGGVEKQVPLRRVASEILRVTSAAGKEPSDAIRVRHARTYR
jgi:two-component system chemotaxis response regulator CheB